ncbi:uncharacterized protein MONOS_2630 [Monocercomonoides exilis]|uniref:uncharacterized protein n=1 Tax=Monocercomonoides exilis TaxID=2049356 RepID=UPI0035599F9D|nr:hypothetical protein MONOS_2630 [Monocercomonoides exilis]|eukprot:MONOS_2630.1-p1 / transcript=MONOS_2630.1 / gene=MONOS_2630 / organism=Monocercomonoides_exilis_PA203 / gene_product=unspecified product / transcript_product=unspecified product / location=Mono_scaffold00055:100574-108412(+) / protein_length=2612 / sequence_SO=supercontig / SO=protein_coding / is_pseudo=false
MHRCLKNSSEHKVYYNNLLQYMNTFQPSISMGNTEIEGKYEKHDLQHDVKENKRYYRTIEPEISGNYRMHPFKEMLKDHIKSKIEGCVCASNSSVELKEIGLVGGERGSAVRGRKGSVVVVRGCVVGMGKGNEAGAFDLCGSIGILTNITLKGWGRGGEIYSGRLFGGSDEGEGSISVSESHFSSFCVSSAPFLSSPSIPLVFLSKLSFFNISTANDACPPPTTSFSQTNCFMSSCSFSSVCDVYDGGIVPSLSNPLASLSVSNTSFDGCTRTGNVEFIGSKENPSKPGRKNTTDNGTNSFIWCEWKGSNALGSNGSENGASSGGAILMSNLANGILLASHCAFYDCFSLNDGGGIKCYSIKTATIESSTFNCCICKNGYGGGMCILCITLCTRISGCDFQNCKADRGGGGLHLVLFNISGRECIGEEKGEGESACIFECNFSSCSLMNRGGGGMCCDDIPTTFKMRSILFFSCSATSYGGGLYSFPNRFEAKNDSFYFYFLFFHECKCLDSPPYGHDMIYFDYFRYYINSNPFRECYTTNTNEQRVCYEYYGSNSMYQHTEKKDWLKEGVKDQFVGVAGDDSDKWCGIRMARPCKTIGFVADNYFLEIKLKVILMEGDHTSEKTTIEIGEKKISVIGKGRGLSAIGMKTLSSSSSSSGALFSVTTGHLGMSQLKVDCNSTARYTPSVVVVSDGDGFISLEDVVITTSKTGDYVMSSSVFEVPLSQLSMADVEIKDMKISKPLFTEPDLSSSFSSSSSSSSSSSTQFLKATSSRESTLANVTVRNVKLTGGDGVVVAKTVEKRETFAVWNATMEGCVCEDGNGGGMKIELETDSSKLRVGASSLHTGGTAKLYRCRSSGYGGGMMLHLAYGSEDFSIVSVDFAGCTAALGGNSLFVNGSNSANWAITNSTLDVEHDESKYDELVGYDRSDTKMGQFPLNVYLDTFPKAAHVGKAKNNLGGFNSWFCGFDYYPCATITHTAQMRFSDENKKIELDIGFELVEEVAMRDGCEWEISCATKGMEVGVKAPENFHSFFLVDIQSKCSIRNIRFSIPSALSGAPSLISSNSSLFTLADCSVVCSSDYSIGYSFVKVIGREMKVERLSIRETLRFGEHSLIEFGEGVESVVFCGCEVNNIEKRNGDGGWVSGVVGAERGEGRNGMVIIETCAVKRCSCVCGRGGGMSVGVKGEGSVVANGSCVIDGCEAKGSGRSEGRSEGRGGGMMISVGDRGRLEMKNMILSDCEVPTADREDEGRGIGGGMFIKLADQQESFVLEGMEFEGCDAWKGKNVFISGWDMREIVNEEHLKWEMSANDNNSLDGLCGWERKTTGEEGYVIPLVVYLRRNWSGDGFVSREKGGDFSGCGYSEAPCSSIDRLISLRYSPLGEGETHIAIVGSGLLSHPISFSFSSSSSSISESPKVVIEGTKKGTDVAISDEDGNAISSGAMISSNMSLSFFNLSFTKPSITTNHAIFIESSGTNTVLSVTDCSFGSSSGTIESFGYCLMRVNGGSAALQSCTLNKINELKGFITFSPSASQVTIRNVNISSATLTANSLISMTEEENQTNGNENTRLNGNKLVLKVVYCSFETIKNEGSSASVIELGSFENAIDCTIEECTTSTCRSDLSTEGGGMKVVLKSGESVLKVNGSSFSMCKCSTETGRGGGLFIDGADSNTNYADAFNFPPLNFKIVNILFRMNDAFVGKDIFIKFHSIEHQINETLFSLNYNQESFGTNNSICGRDAINEIDVDLIPMITFYYSAQVFVNGTGTDNRRCGSQSYPCMSINCGVDHIQEGVMNAILIDGEGVVTEECVIGDLNVNSVKKTQGIVRLNSKIEKSAEKDCVMEFVNECSVERCSFQFEDGFESTHNCLMKVKNGSLEIQKCEFYSSVTTVELKLNSSIVSVESGELKISETIIRDIYSTKSILSFREESEVTIVETRMSNIECEGDVVSIGGKAKVEMKEMKVENVTLLMNGCAIEMDDSEQEVSVLNSSFGKCVNSVDKGSMMQIRNSKDVRIKICVFDGEKETEAINEGNKGKEELCEWNGSLVNIEKSKVEIKETTIRNSKAGGLWVNGGSVKIEKGEFENNNPSIEGYPSARRNVICTGNGELNVVSVKGGDGWERNTSLWILDEGCELGGIVSERDSSFFIPVLEEVKNTTQPTGEMELIIHGKLLLPCNLSVKISMKDGDVELSHTNMISEDGYISESEVHSVISSEVLEEMEKKTEVSVCIVFGKGKTSCSNGIVVVNKSESESKGDGNMNKGGRNNEWSVIVIVVMAALFLIFVFVFVVSVVIHRKKLSEVIEKIEKIEKMEEMEEMGYKEGTTINKREKSGEKRGECFEMIEMPSTLLEGMTSQIPLLIEDEEYSSESRRTGNDGDDDDDNDDEILNENDLSVFGFPRPISEDVSVSVSRISRSHSLKVISVKKPFREKEKKNLKTLHSVIHSVEGDFTLGTRAMDVVDGKEVVLAVAELFEHLISVGDERVGMMGRQLCPYTIFVEEGNNEIFVLREELEDEKEKEEMKRWSAPEAGNEDDGIEKAIVFTLGLMLLETTTGEMPLSEFDAEGAHEMMRDGVRPLIEGIEGEEFVDLIERMWADEPNGRPSLAKVKKWMKRIIKAG